jgi:hypothetical protein
MKVAFVVSFLIAAAMIFFLYWEIDDIGYSVVWCQFSITSFICMFFAISLVPETMGKTLEQIQREFLEEFDVPDFLAAVEYFSEGGTSGNEDDNEETNPLVGDNSGHASPLQVDAP